MRARVQADLLVFCRFSNDTPPWVAEMAAFSNSLETADMRKVHHGYF